MRPGDEYEHTAEDDDPPREPPGRRSDLLTDPEDLAGSEGIGEDPPREAERAVWKAIVVDDEDPPRESEGQAKRSTDD